MKNLFKHLAVMSLALVLLVCVLPMDAEAATIEGHRRCIILPPSNHYVR